MRLTCGFPSSPILPIRRFGILENGARIMTTPSPDDIALDTRVAASSSQIASKLGDESVILSLSDGMYYGLDAVGTRVWALLDRPRPVREICDAIEREHDVEAPECQQAVLALVRDLVDRGLVDVQR